MRLSLTETVKAEARRLGFELVGVTTPEPPPHYHVFERWLEQGRHGEMAYLAKEVSRQRRADPRQILPDCQSILVLGLRYPTRWTRSTVSAAPEVVSSDLSGQIAAYAWGTDYHEVLPPRLRALVTFIDIQVKKPVSNRIYTDTGPVLERDLAQRAGLGWIGKSTCLINPRLGSNIILAEILLGIDLEPDLPFVADHCGTCTRCIDACPTGCIRSNRTLDARRCISYLTIELKGAIPTDLRSQMGGWIFGCDVCQQVCPWNLRFATPDGDPAFAPRVGFQHPNLPGELQLDPQAFNLKFRSSPVLRPHRRGYLRNVATALGNAGRGSAIPVLGAVLAGEPEPLVRAHAAWALGQLGDKSQLLPALASEIDEAVRREIHLALSKPT